MRLHTRLGHRPGSKAADTIGYESEDGTETEDEIDEDNWMHNESYDTSTVKAWDCAAKHGELVPGLYPSPPAPSPQQHL